MHGVAPACRRGGRTATYRRSNSQTVMSPTRSGSLTGRWRNSRSPRRKPGSILPESTTTMGDSVFVTTPRPFHIASAVAITVAKLSAAAPRQPWSYASVRAEGDVDRTDLAATGASAHVSLLIRHSVRTTPSLRIVASSACNMVGVSRRVARASCDGKSTPRALSSELVRVGGVQVQLEVAPHWQ